MTHAGPYSVEANPSRLTYRHGATKKVVVDLERHLPHERYGETNSFEGYAYFGIEQQGDFDGDGRPDALIALSMMGNACGPSYALATEASISPTFFDCAFRSPHVVDCDGRMGFQFRGLEFVDVFALAIGTLNPADTLTGAAARLRNLGLYGRETSTPDDPSIDGLRLAFALELFADSAGAQPGEGSNEAFADRIRKDHGT